MSLMCLLVKVRVGYRMLYNYLNLIFYNFFFKINENCNHDLPEKSENICLTAASVFVSICRYKGEILATRYNKAGVGTLISS